MKKSKNRTKLGTALVNRAFICIFVTFFGMFILTDMYAGTSTERRAIENLKYAADDRADVITNYICNTENTLTAYLKAEQVTALINSPDDSELQAKAQKYTEDFGADIPFLEAVYFSNWNAKVMAHTNPDTSFSLHQWTAFLSPKSRSHAADHHLCPEHTEANTQGTPAFRTDTPQQDN